jgi:hypothetical protein
MTLFCDVISSHKRPEGKPQRPPVSQPKSSDSAAFRVPITSPGGHQIMMVVGLANLYRVRGKSSKSA